MTGYDDAIGYDAMVLYNGVYVPPVPVSISSTGGGYGWPSKDVQRQHSDAFQSLFDDPAKRRRRRDEEEIVELLQ